FLHSSDLVFDEGGDEDDDDDEDDAEDADEGSEAAGDRAQDAAAAGETDSPYADAEPAKAEQANGRGDKGGGRREQGGEKGRPQQRGRRGGGGRRRRVEPPPIQEVLKRGQQIIVQVSKEPISTKGPRVTAQVSLAGRFLVFMPFASRVGVSRKI